MDYRIALVLKQGKKGVRGLFHNIDDGVYRDELVSSESEGGKLKLTTSRDRVLELARDGKGGLVGFFRRPADSDEGTFIPKGKDCPVHLVRGTDYLDPRQDAQGKEVLSYSYQAPGPLADGWPVGKPSEKVKEGLEKAVRKVLDGTIPRVHSLTVVQDGELLLDEYFRGYSPADIHPLHSITKSFFSLLFGVAQDQGLVSTDEKLYGLFTGSLGKDADPRKSGITLDEVLTMTSGLDCDDWKGGCSWDMVESGDWDRFILPRPLARDPGTHFAYCGACLGPLSAVLRERTHMDLGEFAKKWIFDPLGIIDWRWDKGPHGESPVAFGLQMRPRDLAKLGWMVLLGGEWKGKRIVSPEWLARSTVERVPRKKVNGRSSFGYLWWIRDMGGKGEDLDVIYAWGSGGQYLFISPETRLVCVITAGNYKSSSKAAKGLKLFQEYVLKTFRD